MGETATTIDTEYHRGTLAGSSRGVSCVGNLSQDPQLSIENVDSFCSGALGLGYERGGGKGQWRGAAGGGNAGVVEVSGRED